MSKTRKFSKALALLLMLALVLSVFPMTAKATGGTISGTGTQSDPYIIADASDLATFRSNVNGGNSYSGKYVKLTADITTAQTAVIAPSSSYPFAGTFDGDGHTITVNLSGGARTALFGYVGGGTIQNLIVTGSVSSTSSNSGGIVGYLNGGSVLNCGNEASVSATSGYSGGVVGYTGGTCTIDGCYNKGNISGGTRIGGIVGEQYTNVTVSNCYNMGSVTGTSSSNGGVVGYSRGPVSNCYHAVGIISTSYNGGSKGAIIGFMYSSGSMSNCYYVATTTGLLGNSAGTGDATEYDEDDMMEAAAALGDYYEDDDGTPLVNGGYPILYWQGSGTAPNTGVVTALNGLVNTYATDLKAYKESTYTTAYTNNETIYDNRIYLYNKQISAQNSGIDAAVSTVWTTSSTSITIPSTGYGEATVTHSTSEALSVTLTAYLRAVVDGVTYTSTSCVSYTFTVAQDLGAAVEYTVYVSIFDKVKNDPEVSSGGRIIVAVPVTVTGYANTICVDDALTQLHANFNKSGDYAVNSGGMITKLWGITNNNAFAIYRNDTLTNAVTMEPIADGDLITAFAYYSSSYTDRYMYFSNATTTLTEGNSASLPTYYRTYSSSSGTSVSPSSVTVYKLDDTTGALTSTSDVTYSGSTVSASANAAEGTYVLMAKKTAGLLSARYVPGVAIVKVGLSDVNAIAADKASLTITTSGNNEFISCVELPTSGAHGTTISWSASPSGIISSTGLVTRPAQDTSVTLTATITKGNVSDTKTFNVTVPARETDYSDLLPSLTTDHTPDASVVDATNIGTYLWSIMDVIAYENESGNPYISAADKASYYSDIISFVSSVISGTGTNAQKSNDLAKAIIVLKALDYDNSGNNSGYSVSRISVTYNNETKALLTWMEDYTTAAISEAQAAYNDPNDPDLLAIISYLPTASFVLMAELEEHGNTPTTFQTTIRNHLVNNQITSGSNLGAWSTYTDIDAVILAALGYYNKAFSSDTGVQTAINNSATYLSGKQLANGSFGAEADSTVGNANSTAFVLIGLAAANKDASGTAFTKNGNTVVDGLLTYYNDSTDLFQFNGVDNALATEQAFRALVAWDGFHQNSARYVVYEF